MSNKKSGNKLKTLLALTAVLYVTAKVSGSKSSERSYTSQGGEDDDDEFEPETISINYDLTEFLGVDADLDEEVTFEGIVFKLQSRIYKGMGADFIETIKEEFGSLKPGEKYRDVKKVKWLQENVDHYIKEFKEDVKYSKTKHPVSIDDPAKISNELREIKGLILYMDEFIKETEYIVSQDDMDPSVKKVILTTYSLFKVILRFIVHLEVSLAKKLKRSGNEVDAEKIERVVDELEKRGK